MELYVTPLGRLPLSAILGAGFPVPVTANDPAVPSVNVVLAVLVMAGAWFTVNVKFWVAFGETPFEAVMVIGYVPPVFAAGVPLSTPADERVTPLGSAPVSLKVVAGKPVAVTVNDPAVPTVKVVLAVLLMAGAWFTVCVMELLWLLAVPLPPVPV